MEQIFSRILSLSLSAGWLVLAVVLLRLALRRAPRRIVCLLWALVALRLVCPAQIQWRASLVPAQETVAHTAQTTLARPVTPVQTAPAAPAAVSAPQPTAPNPERVLSRVWLAGVGVMLLFAAVSDVRLRLRLRKALRQEENVWLCAELDTPFVLGVLRPRIYLPPGLTEKQTAYVLAHERAHIARGDHLWKPLGWLLLSVYWFHPLLWLAYVLLCRDLELACDERVARGLDRSGLAAYAETLLDCGCRRRGVLLAPVAFGELSVKARVKAILRYRKPVFLRVAAALLAVAAAGAFFLTERPANALQIAEQRAAAQEAPAVTETQSSAPEAVAQEAPSPEPDAEPAPSSTPAAAAWQQPQYTADTSTVDPQAQLEAMVRADTERYIQENRAFIEAREANGTSVTLHTDQHVQTSTGQTQSVGWQSALPYASTQPEPTGGYPKIPGTDSNGAISLTPRP